MRNLRFSFYPAGTEDLASSRIRIHGLQRALDQKGLQVSQSFSRKVDVLYIQKRVTPEILNTAHTAKRWRRTVLYDVDDWGEALWAGVARNLFEEMLNLADVVTTDTLGHRDELSSHFRINTISVVPDAVDYYPSGPVLLPFYEASPLRILWFGSCSNMALFQRYVGALTSIPNVQVVVATDASAVESYSTEYPQINFVEWFPSTFVSVLRSCHLSCLMHDGTVVDRAKSNNRMITSITWGVPAVVSQTPEYERTAKEAQITEALFSNEMELRVAVDRLRSPAARRDYLLRSQSAIWKRYSPAAVADEFLRVVMRSRNSSHFNAVNKWFPYCADTAARLLRRTLRPRGKPAKENT